jgi:hypothetical protein
MNQPFDFVLEWSKNEKQQEGTELKKYFSFNWFTVYKNSTIRLKSMNCLPVKTKY